MKKLILLIFLVMMSLQGFSQKDTKKVIQLKKPIARLVIKDLITGAGAKKEISLLNTKLSLLEKKVIVKDSVILNLNGRVMNFESILSTKTNQIAISQELSKKLQFSLKKQKAKTKLFQYGGSAILIGAVALLLAK